MNILMINLPDQFQQDYRDYFALYKSTLHFANSKLETVQQLNSYTFSKIIVFTDDIFDLAILSYINKHHKDIPVLVSAGKHLQNAVAVIRNSDYKMIDKITRFKDLKLQIMEEK